MAFGENLDLLLPSYLVDGEKTRLKDALLQFATKNSQINYDDFYKDFEHPYFLQSDLIKEIRFAEWDEASFKKAYTDAIIISNTCDISFENKRTINAKQCLVAPIIDLQVFLSDLKENGYKDDQIETFSSTVRSQLSSNIFYLPANVKDNKEYIVLLDNIFWFPTAELNSYEIAGTRLASLSHFGYYLFILKLSYHLCRLPETCDREVNSENIS